MKKTEDGVGIMKNLTNTKMTEDEKIIQEIIKKQGEIICNMIDSYSGLIKTIHECSQENMEELKKLKEVSDKL